MTERKRYIDILRGIGIIFVVYGHIIHIWPDRSYIWTFHMPLFFFISGLLYSPNKYESFIAYSKQKVKTLLIPYLFLYFISLIIYSFSLLFLNGELAIADVLKQFYLMFYGNMTSAGGALWFLPCLFTTEIIFYVISKSFSNKVNQLISSFILAIIGVLLYKYKLLDLPFGLNITLLIMPFYCIGFLSNNVVTTLLKSNIYIKLTVIILCIVLQYILFDYSGLDLAMNYLKNEYIYIPMALSGIILYLTISLILKQNTILEWLGKNTIVIFTFHGIIYKIFIYLFALIASISYEDIRTNYIYSIIITIFTIISLIPCCKVYNSTINNFIRKI